MDPVGPIVLPNLSQQLVTQKHSKESFSWPGFSCYLSGCQEALKGNGAAPTQKVAILASGLYYGFDQAPDSSARPFSL